MPSKTNSDRILDLERDATTVAERVDNLRREVERLESRGFGSGHQLNEVERRLLLVENNLSRLEKRVDDILARRWELWKLVLAAFLGSILTIASGFVSRVIDRAIESTWDKQINVND